VEYSGLEYAVMFIDTRRVYMNAIVTVVGQDRVGIIAAICNQLAGFNVNILDISQTVLQEYFTMMMVVDVTSCNVPLAELCKAMDAKGQEMGLSIRVQREDIFEAMHRG
jgi:ACT domain-containing protein